MVGSNPNAVVYDGANGYLYVSNRNSNNVTIINGATDTVVVSITVGNTPYAVAYDGANGYLYVANEGSNTVTGLPARMTVMATPSLTSGPAWLNDSFSASAYGGSWIYKSWVWSFGDGNTSNMQNASHTYTRSGTYQANVTVTDSTGTKATSNTVWVNVTHPLAFSAVLTPSKTTVSVGEPAWVNASMSGGVGPFSFKWNATPAYAGCVDSTTSSVATCTPTFPGKAFFLGVEITDLYGATGNATSPNVTVSSLSALLSAFKTTVGVGQPVLFNTSTSGDSATLSYTYMAPLAAGCAASTGPSVTCTPQKPGWSFRVNVTVTDQYGNSWNATSPTVSTGTPTVTVVPSRIAVDVNESMTFEASVTGDLASLSYSYASTPMAGCAPSTSAALTCTPKSNGTFSVSVTATDSYGNAWTATSITVKVYPALIVHLTLSSSTPLLAQTVAIIANASGGNPSYNYTYLGLPYGCYSENKSSIGCLPTQSDWYNVTVVVTDLNDGSARVTVAMHVIFDFNVVIPASTPVGQQLTIMVNTNETFNGTAIHKTALFSPDSGYGAFTYNYSGLPPGCVSKDVATLTCTPTQAGNYSVTISVHDQAGDHQAHSVVVHIAESSSRPPHKSTSPSPGFMGLSGDEGYLLVGVIVVVVAAGVAFLLMRKGAPPKPASSASKEPGEDKVPEKTGGREEPSPEKKT